jgi:hypothetical protein
MNAATSKLAQTAKGSRTCEACGRTKALSAFGIHPRWKTPMRKCEMCMTDIRRMAGAKKAKTHAKARVKKATVEAREVVKQTKQQAASELIWAKLDGYALAMRDDGALSKLLAELRRAVG